MSTTDPNPVPEQWSAAEVSAAFARGDVEAIQTARYAGLLDAILNPSQEG